MLVWPTAGALVGILNACTRWWTVAQAGYDRPSRVLPLALGGMIVRLVMVTALLTVALREGLFPGLLTFGGMWLARWGSVIWTHAKGVDRLSTRTMGDQ